MKYFKPKSVTWWAGAAALGAGCVLAVHEGYDLGGLGVTLEELTGGLGAYTLLVQGAGLIGLRGAFNDQT
jgi:hypothetical protein